MTKRFTPKASDYTARMAVVQKKMARLKKELSVLEAEERSLKAYLPSYYDEGHTLVELADGTQLDVNYSTSERTYLDQDKAVALLDRLGKKVPRFNVTIETFKVRAVK
jgi:hypothetical protein